MVLEKVPAYSMDSKDDQQATTGTITPDMSLGGKKSQNCASHFGHVDVEEFTAESNCVEKN